MNFTTLTAHFDGEQIRLDEPYELEPNTRLLVTVLPGPQNVEEQQDLLYLSTAALANAYGEDEPDYPLRLIKEANPEYEGR